MAEKQINQQVLDAVMTTNLSVLGNSGVQGQAVTYEALAHSLALIMHNAGATQFNSQQVSNVAVARVCAAIAKTTE